MRPKTILPPLIYMTNARHLREVRQEAVEIKPERLLPWALLLTLMTECMVLAWL